MALKKFNSPLTLAVLSSSLFVISTVQALDITMGNSKVTTQTTSIIGEDIVVKPDGYISVPGASAVVIDTANKLTIEANNASGFAPGVSTTGAATTVNVTGVNAAGSGVTIGAASGIENKGTGVPLMVDLATKTGFTLDNTGTITSAGVDDAIQIANTVSPVVINRGAGIITGGLNGIKLTDATTFVITNEAGGTITQIFNGANQAAISLNNTNTGIITNQGILKVDGIAVSGAAINVVNGSTTAVITNASGANITSKGGGIVLQAASAANKVEINNAGTITAAVDGIRIDGDNTANIHNMSTGVINAGAAANESAIVINDTFTGNITNDGTLTATEAGIWIQSGNTTGDVTNNNIITVTDISNAVISGGLRTTGTITGNLINTGTVTVTGNNLSAFRLDGNITGNVTNSGTATASGNHALSLGANIGGNFTNTGTLSQTLATGQQAVQIDAIGSITGIFDNQGTILSNSNTQAAITVENDITGGFFNSGNITSTNHADAISFDFGGTTMTNYTQTGGTVTGNIRGHGGGFTATFTGGTVAGDLILGPGNDTVNIQNTTFTGSLLGNPAGTDTLNITSNFTNAGQIKNFTDINVNAGTFIIDNPVDMKGGGTFKINAGTTVISNSTFTDSGVTLVDLDGTLILNDGATLTNAGDLANDGVLKIADTAMMTVGGNLIGDGTYGFEVTDTATFGKLKVLGTGNMLNDSIAMEITGEGLIQAGDTFKLIDAGVPLLNNGPGVNIIQPASQSVNFAISNAAGDPNITVVAIRNPFQGIAVSENATTIGTALDLLVTDPTLHPDIKTAISQIDIQPTQEEVSRALESLVPEVDYGLVQVSHDFHTKIHDSVIGRLERARNFYDVVKTVQSGDEPYWGLGAWGKIFGSSLRQREIGGVEGYSASSTGISLGGDKMINPDFIVGGALTYAVADVQGKNDADNEVDINSIQLTGYSSFHFPGAISLDTVVTAGLNRYKSKRHIEIGTLVRTARANYKAWQYSAQMQAGYHLAYEKYRITPILGAHFTMLDIDSYTESTAGGLNLAVEPKNVPEFASVFGVRFASLNEYVEALYVPELRIMAHYDFIRERQVTNSNFVSNGTIFFETRGPKPDPMTYNVGTALTAYGQNLIFQINYDLEFRKQYLGHYGHIKLRYEW